MCWPAPAGVLLMLQSVVSDGETSWLSCQHYASCAHEPRSSSTWLPPGEPRAVQAAGGPRPRPQRAAQGLAGCPAGRHGPAWADTQQHPAPQRWAACCRAGDLPGRPSRAVQGVHTQPGSPAVAAQPALPFQRAGVRYGLAHQGRILLADEMGVGKTVQALALSACYQVCSSLD